MSRHLQDIVDRHHQIANAQIVFSDIEAYSKRRTQNQIAVVEAFTASLTAAMTSVSQRYVAYAQTNNINFGTDVIRLPTGDGAAVVFTFDGLHDIHLAFALELLHECEKRRDVVCERFESEGWCNCHPYYNLRIGVSEGKSILFKDMNGVFNLAGGAINMAARVMGLVDRNQVAFTAHAYEQLIDLANDPNLADKFAHFPSVRIKHDLRIDIYQYVAAEAEGLSATAPEGLTVSREMERVLGRMKGLMGNLPMPEASSSPADALAVMQTFDSMMDAMLPKVASIQAAPVAPAPSEHGPQEQDPE